MKKKIESRTRIRKLSRSVFVKIAKDNNAQMAAQILRIDNFFADVLHTPALRPAVRLLLRIMVKRSISIKEAMMDSPLSYRAFYIMIDRLKEAGLIDVASDDSDRRVRLLVLGSEFNRMIVKLPAYLEKAEAEEIRLEKEAVSEFR